MSAPHVLVVEDSPTQARLLCLILESEGFTVEAVGDGHAALAGGGQRVCGHGVLAALSLTRIVRTVRQGAGESARYL